MCGICGFIGKKFNYKKVATDLLTNIESRGKDATGYATIIEDDPRRMFIAKEPVPATEFLKKNAEKLLFGSTFIGHTRAATSGCPSKNLNNHPVRGKNFVLVHNGIVSCMPRIKNYAYEGEVDTEIILSYIETKGLQEGLKEISGSAAIAILDRPTGNLYLFRHLSPLIVANLTIKGEKHLIFASTEDAIMKALEKYSVPDIFELPQFPIGSIPEDTLFKISPKIEVEKWDIEIKQAVWNGVTNNQYLNRSYYQGHLYGGLYGYD